MKDSIKKILFHKHILVNDTERDPERVFEVCFSLAKLLNIKITEIEPPHKGGSS